MLCVVHLPPTLSTILTQRPLMTTSTIALNHRAAAAEMPNFRRRQTGTHKKDQYLPYHTHPPCPTLVLLSILHCLRRLVPILTELDFSHLLQSIIPSSWMMMMMITAMSHPLPLQDHHLLFQILIVQDKSPLL